MHTQRAPTVSAPPLNCGVSRQVRRCTPSSKSARSQAAGPSGSACKASYSVALIHAVGIVLRGVVSKLAVAVLLVERSCGVLRGFEKRCAVCRCVTFLSEHRSTVEYHGFHV